MGRDCFTRCGLVQMSPPLFADHDSSFVCFNLTLLPCGRYNSFWGEGEQEGEV